jgi:hypothetical protein
VSQDGQPDVRVVKITQHVLETLELSKQGGTTNNMRSDRLEEVAQTFARDARLVRFVHVIHDADALEPALQVIAKLEEELRDHAGKQGFPHSAMNVRHHAIRRQPVLEALPGPLKIALQSRFEFGFGFAFLPLKTFDEPLDRAPILRGQLAFGGGQPVQEHFRIATRVRLTRHPPKPADTCPRKAVLERRFQRPKPAPQATQRHPEVVEGLAAALRRQALALYGEVLDQRHRDEPCRPRRRVVEQRRVERRPALSRRGHATGLGSGAIAAPRNRHPRDRRCEAGRPRPS